MAKQLLPLVFLLLAGCRKSDKVLLSSSKSIASVVFKLSDNPGLPADITGLVSSDSISFKIPQHILIDRLIPTIDYRGKKIEPVNRTAQDFTNGIRYRITAEDGSTQSYFFQVTRTASDTTALVLGTWKVLKDSVVNNNWSNPAGGNLTPGVYTGTALDYWKFDANGVFSARENNITGSSTYTIRPDKKLDIPVWTVQYGPGTIKTLSDTHFTVYFAATSANGGQYFRKVYLKR